jgi:hypothetical protein
MAEFDRKTRGTGVLHRCLLKPGRRNTPLIGLSGYRQHSLATIQEAVCAKRQIFFHLEHGEVVQPRIGLWSPEPA